MTLKSCQIDNYSLRPLKHEVGVCISRSVLSDSVTTWAVARQAPMSMGVSRQEYWDWLPFPPPGNLPDPGTEPEYLVSLALAGGFFTTRATWEAQ